MKRSMLILVAIATSLAGVRFATAVGRPHNGIDCRGGNGTGYSTNYGVFNSTVSPLEVICSIQRDQGQPSNTFTRLTAYIYDRNTVTDFDCRLRLMHNDGTLIYSASGTVHGFGSGLMPPVVWNPNVSLIFTDTATLTCTIPATDPVNSYSYLTTYVSEEN